MSDVFSKEKRSWIMSRIKGKDTRFELMFFKALSKRIYPLGYRYRKHNKHLPGTPDLVFKKFKLAVFLDGDFWHGWHYSKLIKRRTGQYWVNKIKDNISRDEKVNVLLMTRGWHVIRIWEHEVYNDLEASISSIISFLESSQITGN